MSAANDDAPEHTPPRENPWAGIKADLDVFDQMDEADRREEADRG